MSAACEAAPRPADLALPCLLAFVYLLATRRETSSTTHSSCPVPLTATRAFLHEARRAFRAIFVSLAEGLTNWEPVS